LNRVFPFLFLLIVFGSLISSPLFIDVPQNSFLLISQALAEESSDGESESGGEEEKEEEEAEEEEKEEEEAEEEEKEEEEAEEEEKEEEEAEEEEKEEEEAEEEKCDETDEETENTELEIDEQKCDEQEKEEEEKEEEEKEEEEKEEEEKEEEEKEEEEKEEAEEEKEIIDTVTDNKEHTVLEEIIFDGSLIEEVINDESTDKDLVSTLLVIKQEQTETDKIGETKGTVTDIDTNSEEHTVLDAILSDASLLNAVANDDTTGPILGSALLDIQNEPVQNLSTETCANQVDDDADGTIDEEDCNPATLPPIQTTETCANQVDDDADGTIDEEDCVVAPTEICANQVDDDADGTIDEEDCVVAPTEICDNNLDDDADGMTDDADENDCPAIMPAVVIESAEDQEGEPLSPGDIIAPGEVTFTFSATKIDSTDTPVNPQTYNFECALDDETYSACSSPMTIQMDDGKHTFVVRLAQ
jgi:hypothetical protein